MNEAMKTACYALVGDEDSSKKECGTTFGELWLEAKPGKYYCFYLTAAQHSCSDDIFNSV